MTPMALHRQDHRTQPFSADNSVWAVLIGPFARSRSLNASMSINDVDTPKMDTTAL